jgi:hypothetical protein
MLLKRHMFALSVFAGLLFRSLFGVLFDEVLGLLGRA